MGQNPYTPLQAAEANDANQRSFACVVMFWLSLFLGLVAFAIAANGIYQFWIYSTQSSVPLAPSILAESVCIAFSGIGMIFAAIKWRRQAVRAGAIALACSLVLFFVGPIVV